MGKLDSKAKLATEFGAIDVIEHVRQMTSKVNLRIADLVEQLKKLDAEKELEATK